MPEREIIVTEDGSHTLFVPELGETYHSTHGAVQESKHVFIRAGLEYLVNFHAADQARIFEVGFGTGLNALLSAQYAQNHQISIRYTTIETFPLEREEWSGLNYPEIVGERNVHEIFQKIHEAPWEHPHEILPVFMLTKIRDRAQDYETPEKFDICYFDAFAPSKQPEMWDMKILQKIHGLLENGGIFVTYSARWQLKRDLVSLGFEVEKLSGPPGKNEMVRAVRKS